MITRRSDVQHQTGFVNNEHGKIAKFAGCPLPVTADLAGYLHFRHGLLAPTNCAFRFKWNDRYDRFRPYEILADRVRIAVMPCRQERGISNVVGVYIAGFALARLTRPGRWLRLPFRRPFFGGRRFFRSPSRCSETADPAQEPVEVQLFVSPDRGVHWDNRPWMKAHPKGLLPLPAPAWTANTGSMSARWTARGKSVRKGRIRPSSSSSSIRAAEECN